MTKRRLLASIAIALGSLAALFVGASAIAFLLVDVDALVHEQIQRYRPAIEERLGREVEVGAVSTRFFPTLGARIEGIRVGAAPGAENEGPLLAIGSAGFDLDLLGVLLSAGRKVDLDAIYLDGVRVEVVRRADGTLSLDDILARLEKPAEEEEAAQEETDLGEILERIAVGEVRMADAAIVLVDRAAPGGAPVESAIRQIDLRLRDFRFGKPVSVQLRAAAFAEKRNVDVQAVVGPIPADLKLEGLPPVRDVRMRLDRLDVAPALPYLPVPLRAAVVSSDLRIPQLSSTAESRLQGYLAVDGLRFEGGEATDLRLEIDLIADLAHLGADVERLALRIGRVQLDASGKLRDLGHAPRFENFVVRSTTLEPRVLLAAFPMLGESLPAGSEFAGAARLDLRASGTAERQTLALAIDLGPLAIRIPDAFQKPAEVPLALRVEGDFGPDFASLRKANLRLDELDLDLSGTVRDFAAPVYDFTLAAKPFSVDRMVRLLPQAAVRLEAAQARAGGKGSISGHLEGGPGKLSANLALALEEVEIELPDTTVRGGLRTRLFASGDPAARLRAGLLFDAGDSVIRIPGLIRKDATTPFVVDVVADKRGNELRFEKFDVRLAEASLVASGAMGLAGGDAALAVELRPVDLERLARTIPAIPAERVKNGSVEGRLSVRGNPSALATVAVDLERFALRLGRSDIQAKATVRNLEAPEIAAEIRSAFLDLDELLPAGEEEGAPAKAEEREDDPELRRIRAVATFEVGRARFLGRTMERLRGRLTLRDGLLQVEQAEFDLYGGRVRANGTSAEIWRGAIPFQARFSAEQVDVGRLLVGEADRKPLLEGRGSLQVNLDGAGFDREALERSLTGGWSLGLSNGRITAASITSSVLSGLGEVPGLDRRKLAAGEGELRDLLASFAVEGGRMNLQKPLQLRLDGNRVELGGAIGIGGDLFLDGNYFVSPTLIARLTGNRCQLPSEAAVPLRIRGSATAPSIQPDAKELAVLLGRSCLADKATAAVERLTGTSADEARRQVEEAKAAAEAQRRELEEAAARGMREAEEKARQQAKEAEDELKRRAKDARKKLGF